MKYLLIILLLFSGDLMAQNYHYGLEKIEKEEVIEEEETVEMVFVDMLPLSDGGTDLSLTLPDDTTLLSGTGSDPDGGSVTYRWTQVSGPNTAVLTGADTEELSVSSLVAGVYVFGLAVTDEEGNTVSDEVSVSVESDFVDELPIADASGDLSLTLPDDTTLLSGTGSDPDGGSVTYRWTQVSGPNTAVLTGADTEELSVSSLVAGVYVFGLAVTDEEGNTVSDEVSVSVESDFVDELPIADASGDLSLTLPDDTTLLSGTGSDPDGGSVTYRWMQVSGPNTAVLTGADTEEISVSSLVAGVYVFGLAVTDEEGNTVSDEVSVFVVANKGPTAIAEATPSSGILPLEVSFVGNMSSDDKVITSYQWNFNDGTTVSTADALHTFTEAGSYAVTLKVTDEEGLNSSDTVTITVSENANEPPVAKASANVLSGTGSLEVSFTGSNSTDDKTVSSYSWNFKDGSTSTMANPSHTFNDPGTYAVELTVRDGEGLIDTETITISVNEPVNEAPVAAASASVLTGDAPLLVSFRGSDSSDDKGITSYFWDIPGGSSSSANPSRTFDSPGFYDIKLTVTDGQGLQDMATLAVTVNQVPSGNPGGDQIPCGIGGGRANETGSKVWCWDDIDFPSYSGTTGVTFNNGELAYASECDIRAVTKQGNKVKFDLNPTTPEVEGWCSRNFNMRAEDWTAPWDVRHPRGTEEWFGWTYEFDDSYVIDQNNEWLFFQIHNGVVGNSPPIELLIARSGLYGAQAGEIIVKNGANYPDNVNTGVVPKARDKFDIVVHVVHGDASNGLLQVWINGSKVYDRQVRTYYSASPWGGNAKWGIYKWPWAKEAAVEQSRQQGVTNITTYMGPLRMITRRPGDADYGKDSYEEVAPN